MILLYSLLFTLISAQRPSNISICDYYTQVKYGSATKDNQFRMIENIVALAFAGPASIASMKAPKELTGILNPGIQDSNPVDLLSFFNGTFQSTNLNNQRVGINWLDDGGLAPLANYLSGKTQSVILTNSSNEYRLFGHFYASFAHMFGCSEPPDPPSSGGSLNLAYAHKFMSLNHYQLAYFIDQLTRASEMYGFSAADAQALDTYMNSLYNVRCAPPTILDSSKKGPQLLSLCQDPSCPLAVPNSDCEAYVNLSADGVVPSDTVTTPTPTSSPGTPTDSAVPLSSNKRGLSTGGIAGVAIGSIAAISLIAAAVFYFRRNRPKKSAQVQTQQQFASPEPQIDQMSPQSESNAFSPNSHWSYNSQVYGIAELDSPKSPSGPAVELSGATVGVEKD